MVWFGPQPCNCRCQEDDDDDENPECLCAEDDEYVSPHYISEYEIVISDIPDTYNESRTTDSVSLLGNGNSEITIELSGFAALNGTYATSLKNNDNGESCTSDNSDCPLDDSAAGCVWQGNLMRVSITGTLYTYSYVEITGNPPEEEEATYDLFGTAAIAAGNTPTFFNCVVAAYRTINGTCYYYGNFGFSLSKIEGVGDRISFLFGNNDAGRFTCTTGDLYYDDPPDIEPWAIIPKLLDGGFFGGGISVDPCDVEALAPSTVPVEPWGPYCNAPDCNYTIAMSADACSGTYDIGGGLIVGGTVTITYAYDGFACTIESNCTLLS